MKELTKCLEQFEASCLDLSITVDQLHAVTANRQNFLELLHVIQPDSMLTNRYLISLELGANEFRSVRAALRAVIGYVSDGGFGM